MDIPPRPTDSLIISPLVPPTVSIELRHVPDCPLVNEVRDTLRSVLADAGVEATVTETEGDFASPTLLVNGVDVTGAPPEATSSCRLDLPTREQILSALMSRPTARGQA